MVLFDLGAEIDLGSIDHLLGGLALPAPLVSRMPAPTSLTLPAPLRVEVPADRFGIAPPGTRLEVRLHALGVLAVRVRIPFEGSSIQELPNAAAGVRLGPHTPRQAARRLCEDVQAQIPHALIEPYDVAVEPETYTVYCLHDALPARLLNQDASPLAGVLIGERNWASLAPATIEDTLQRRIQYTTDDLVAVGWDNAIAAFPSGDYEDVLDVMELANLELLELRTLDALMDARIDLSVAQLERLWARGGLFRSARGLLEDLSELRADFVRIRDSIHDQGKIYGDWYLAKVHQRLRDRFHLAEWENAVETKMESLGAMFQLAGEETNHRRALLLELMIVLLFVIDLLALFLLPH